MGGVQAAMGDVAVGAAVCGATGDETMTEREALKRIAQMQGTLLKLVAQLESCKLLLYPREK